MEAIVGLVVVGVVSSSGVVEEVQQGSVWMAEIFLNGILCVLR